MGCGSAVRKESQLREADGDRECCRSTFRRSVRPNVQPDEQVLRVRSVHRSKFGRSVDAEVDRPKSSAARHPLCRNHDRVTGSCHVAPRD